MSIVLLAILAVMWVAFLSPLVTPSRPVRAAADGRVVRRHWRRQVELPLWSAPLLEGQASSRPE